ncbi:endonuclease VII domain-containing protein [Micromonospora sp. NPDC020750]|uniref:endonuclease VII domain-containing protein n=1 Tax=unclassified Micromonospora TaxID=2617518 RepID=UPI0037BB7D91
MELAGEATKSCTVCKTTKPVTAFSRWSRSKDGLSSRCKSCASEKDKEYRAKHHALVLAGKKATYRRNPEQIRAKNEQWKARNPERHKYLVRRSWLKQIYGITHEQYDALMEAQGGACAICNNPSGGTRLAIDHDHSCCPGKKSCGQCIRGLLCMNCNRLLGWFDNRREVITDYVNRYEARRGL